MREVLDDVMTAKDVAERAGVTVARIHQLCRDETIEAVKIANVWLISRKSALAWIYSDRTRGPKKRDAKS